MFYVFICIFYITEIEGLTASLFWKQLDSPLKTKIKYVLCTGYHACESIWKQI